MASSNRFLYETSTALDQTFLDKCHDDLTNQLEFIVDIETPTGYIRASNRNKYVDSIFYEALLNVPQTTRTIGDWLESSLQFSDLELEISNVDGRFNEFLPAGDNYADWIHKTVVLKVGLRDVGSTYQTLFSGYVSDVQGFGRTVKSIKLIARDRFQDLNTMFPKEVFHDTIWPDIEPDKIGLIVPVIYGDWTTNVTLNGASVRVFQVNGNDFDVYDESGLRNPVEIVVSVNENTQLNTSDIYLRRSNKFYNFDPSDIIDMNAGKNYFRIKQNSVTNIGDDKYFYESSDEFFVRCKGKDLIWFNDNIVEQAKDILITYGGANLVDFDSSWNQLRDKSSPPQSAISTFKSRIYQAEQIETLTFALSLLEQVRLEAFINKFQKIELKAMHFESFSYIQDYVIKNWDIVKDSISISIDAKNNFNRVRGVYNKLPDVGEEAYQTGIYKNQAAIDVSREISKIIVFPNLYDGDTVKLQLIEIVRMASTNFEIIELDLTWRSLLIEVGDFLWLDISIEGVEYKNVPCLVRSKGIDPNGIKIKVQLFSFQMMPYPSYAPSYSGIIGGYNATITEET